MVEFIATNSIALGEYVYFDIGPIPRYQSRSGLWNGDWTICKPRNRLLISQKDHTNSWQEEDRNNRKYFKQ